MNKNSFPNKFFSIVTLFLLSLFVLFIDDLSLIANVCFYLYLVIIIVNYLSTKDVSLDIIWLTGFIFIILAEMFFTHDGPAVLEVTKYIVLGNNIILIAYYCPTTKKYYLVRDYRLRNRVWYVTLCLVATIVYTIVVLPNALLAWRYGRAYADIVSRGNLFTFVVSNFSYVIPAIWAYYYKDKRGGVLIAFILSFPYFALQFMGGTRFRVLFSVLSFAIGSGKIKLYHVKIKELVIYVFFAAILMSSINLMKVFRVSGANSDDDKTILTVSNVDGRLPAKIVSYGSSEGIINANTWLFDYCNKNGFSYGKQSSFIFYWWIPRSIWKNKPSMTGGWLPHMYGNFAEGHSASIGIWGELYVDFGYFSFLFLFLVGLLMRLLDSYCRYLLTEKRYNINMLKAAIFTPYIFFSVRSPITSFITLSVSLLFLYIFRYLLFEKVE